MKKASHENKDQHVGSSVFVLVGFTTFFIMFLSLGNSTSFRAFKTNTEQVTTESGLIISKQNDEFINTYMPYFEQFALDYNHEYSNYENYMK